MSNKSNTSAVMADVPPLQRQETVSSSKAAHGAADMTRRMVCGGLAGMIAKVSHISSRIYCINHHFFLSVFSQTHSVHTHTCDMIH